MKRRGYLRGVGVSALAATAAGCIVMPGNSGTESGAEGDSGDTDTGGSSESNDDPSANGDSDAGSDTGTDTDGGSSDGGDTADGSSSNDGGDTTDGPSGDNGTTGDGDETRFHRLAGEEAWGGTNTEETDTSWTLDTQIELESGYYVAYSFRPQRSVQYHCEWETEGNPMDVFLLDRREYDDRWRDAEQIQYLSSFTETDTTQGSVSGGVQAGEYVVVLSNSEKMGTRPEGSVRADVEFGASIE